MEVISLLKSLAERHHRCHEGGKQAGKYFVIFTLKCLVCKCPRYSLNSLSGLQLK